MTEPFEVAERVEEIRPGLYHWRIRNSRIGGAISSSHALAVDGESVFVDPVRLRDEALATLPRPATIALTAACHQRAAWRYRADFGAQVLLPEDARPGDQEPDRRYADGELLPGGLRAIRTPGPEWPHYCFLCEERHLLLCSDLVSATDTGELRFVPGDYHEDPAETRRSVERILELPFEILCLAHGPPLLDDPKNALRRLLARPA